MTYIDYDGNERTEDFHFNLSKKELMAMEIGEGISDILRKIVEEKDNKRIVEMFEEILMKSYGVKSPDGKLFIKSEELSKAFSQTEAYSDLFIELATNTEASVAFINAIVPKNIN